MSKIRIGIATLIVCAVAFPSTAVFAQDNSARKWLIKLRDVAPRD